MINNEWVKIKNVEVNDDYCNVDIYDLSKDKRKEFMSRLYFNSNENKKGLIDTLGFAKAYNVISISNDNVDIDAIWDIKSSYETRYSFFGADLYQQKCGIRYVVDKFLNEIYEFCNIYAAYVKYSKEEFINRYDEDYLSYIKHRYTYIDSIAKIRNIPKITRLFSQFANELKDKYRFTNSIEGLIAKINDILYMKPKKYIIEVSTDPRDIITASVSDNYTTCYDIKRGACNCASVNYLAMDDKTMSVKLYEYDFKNEQDYLNVINNNKLDYNKCISRCFISYDYEQNAMVLGQSYPSDRFLTYKLKKEILDTLFNFRYNDDTDTRNSDYNDMSRFVEYGNNFVGYQDYILHDTIVAIPNDLDHKISVGNKGALMYKYVNVICDWHTNVEYKLLKITKTRPSTSSMATYNRTDGDDDYDEDDEGNDDGEYADDCWRDYTPTLIARDLDNDDVETIINELDLHNNYLDCFYYGVWWAVWGKNDIYMLFPKEDYDNDTCECRLLIDDNNTMEVKLDIGNRIIEKLEELGFRENTIDNTNIEFRIYSDVLIARNITYENIEVIINSLELTDSDTRYLSNGRLYKVFSKNSIKLFFPRNDDGSYECRVVFCNGLDDAEKDIIIDDITIKLNDLNLGDSVSNTRTL